MMTRKLSSHDQSQENYRGDLSRDFYFQPARFEDHLELPAGDQRMLHDAARAVREEFREGSRWKRLQCIKVSLFAERERAAVYAIHVDGLIEFDWTWEGAVAFCRVEMGDLYFDQLGNAALDAMDARNDLAWSGEILHVDEQAGCLFISLDDTEQSSNTGTPMTGTPKTGAFYVRPFDFLGTLNAIYNDSRFETARASLTSRLAATKGDIHPKVDDSRADDSRSDREKDPYKGLSSLRHWWEHSWCLLWGPPGTGKTYTTGQQIGRLLRANGERVLVVSTTNRATDEVAISIGKAAAANQVQQPASADPPALPSGSSALRIGKGANYQSFASQDLQWMLAGTEVETMAQIGELSQRIARIDTSEEKAFAKQQLGALREQAGDQSARIFVDPDVSAVVSTVFKATSLIDHPTVREMIDGGHTPFTTIVIDEAGLISRAAVAALSLLASRRVVLVGDSKQLAPISRLARARSTREMVWLASSGLSHLDATEKLSPGVHLLSEQHRMHPDICRIVSDFQYAGKLTTAEPTRQRSTEHVPALLRNFSAAIWYVLDEESIDGKRIDLSSIRATPGPGNRSWIRNATFHVLTKLFADPEMRQAAGLFISPFLAQANAVAQMFAQRGMDEWEASTVHSQQGYEKDLVIFDTVNAGSTGWQPEEWKRLVNVAISRARQSVMVIASCSEMEEPFLRPLRDRLTPAVLENASPEGLPDSKAESQSFRWRSIDADLVRSTNSTYQISRPGGSADHSLGNQFAARKQLRPILSQEQQRLAGLEMDGRPRLVRGVAGSGKSLVLSTWLARTVHRRTSGGQLAFADERHDRIWAVYANRSLHKLLRETVEAAWTDIAGEDPFPWEQVELLHILDVLRKLLPTVQLNMQSFEFDYDQAAREFLSRQDAADLLPRCQALFIDEAQDMGPSTLKLLLSLVEQTDPADTNSRSAHIFYDNAQNIYDRGTPRWSEFGLNMRGRSTIMKESFRSTVPIIELAINLNYRLTEQDFTADQREMISLDLLKETSIQTPDGEQSWLQVNFNQVDGQDPVFCQCETIGAEIDAIAKHLKYLISQEKVAPCDICILYNGKGSRSLLEEKLSPQMQAIDVELSVQTNRAFERRNNTLLVTTPQSFKGYEAEVVVIPFVDHFITADQKILNSSLYVAMTRARSILAMYAIKEPNATARNLCDTLALCVDLLNMRER